METKKYLKFVEVSPLKPRKTKIFQIWNVVKKEHIGIIIWDTAWRKYISISKQEIGFTSGCHREVADFIDNLMKEREEIKLHGSLETPGSTS